MSSVTVRFSRAVWVYSGTDDSGVEGVRASHGRREVVQGPPEGAVNRSVAKLLYLLGTVFRFAPRQESNDPNPAAAVPTPRAPSTGRTC